MHAQNLFWQTKEEDDENVKESNFCFATINITVCICNRDRFHDNNKAGGLDGVKGARASSLFLLLLPGGVCLCKSETDSWWWWWSSFGEVYLLPPKFLGVYQHQQREGQVTQRFFFFFCNFDLIYKHLPRLMKLKNESVFLSILELSWQLHVVNYSDLLASAKVDLFVDLLKSSIC